MMKVETEAEDLGVEFYFLRLTLYVMSFRFD